MTALVEPISVAATPCLASRFCSSGRGSREHRIRLYTATRLAELCLDAGLVVEEAYDGWRDRPLRRRSSEMVLVARKRELPRRRRGG